jgi:peptidoglycan-associated lipoprotein
MWRWRRRRPPLRRKRPPQPRPPAGPPAETGTSTIVPGSQADLRQQAGSDTVLFAYDSYELMRSARHAGPPCGLAEGQWQCMRVTLEGHCDERGTREYNLALGDRRANSAKNFLAGQGIAVIA